MFVTSSTNPDATGAGHPKPNPGVKSTIQVMPNLGISPVNEELAGDLPHSPLSSSCDPSGATSRFAFDPSELVEQLVSVFDRVENKSFWDHAVEVTDERVVTVAEECTDSEADIETKILSEQRQKSLLDRMINAVVSHVKQCCNKLHCDFFTVKNFEISVNPADGIECSSDLSVTLPPAVSALLHLIVCTDPKNRSTHEIAAVDPCSSVPKTALPNVLNSDRLIILETKCGREKPLVKHLPQVLCQCSAVCALPKPPMEAVSFCLASSSGWIFGIFHNTKRVTYITNTISIVHGQGIPEVVYQMMFLWAQVNSVRIFEAILRTKLTK